MQNKGCLKPWTLLPTAPGTCKECGVKHDPEQPHNKQSMAYQYYFYNQHGRFPTWQDAMSHCSDEVKEIWTKELKLLGEKVGE